MALHSLFGAKAYSKLLFFNYLPKPKCMKSYTFTPDGVQQLLKFLYQLPDAALKEEALVVSLNLPLWIAFNFTLNQKQLSFFTNMKAPSLSYMSAQISFALLNRLPIILIKPEGNGNDDMLSCSYIDSTNDLKNSADKHGNMLATGSLTFEIRY